MKQFTTILFLICTIALFTACTEEKQEVKKELRPVRYQKVGFYDGDKLRTFSGTSRNDKITKLSFRSTGIITYFNIKIGQKVRRGQQLARLDNVQARLNYQNALSQQNTAESAMKTAKLNYDRVMSLYEKGSSALSDFEAAKNQYTSAKNSFDASKKTVALQQEQIQYGYLVAPANGIISAVSAEIDENVSPGQTIATLNSGSDMEISLGLPETVINQVKQDMKVDVSFVSIPNKTFVGKVTEVSPAVDENTATYPVRVVIADPSEEIKSGMAANVTFDFMDEDTKAKKDQIVVPANAVGEDSEGNFVFLIQGEGKKGTVKRQTVTIGELTREGFVITSGLQSGQRIATAGLQTLLNGEEVKLN